MLPLVAAALTVALVSSSVSVPHVAASRIPHSELLTRSALEDFVMMGRAEKRMAKKRAAKGQQYQGGRPITAPTSRGGAARDDRLPRSVMLQRLGEVPVFGLLVESGTAARRTEAGYLCAEDGLATFYMDAREAEAAVAAQQDGGVRMAALSLDQVYFDSSARLKPSDGAARDALACAGSAMVAEVRTPLFCIDGMQTTSKQTGVASLPLFFSRDDLLQFATPVFGAKAAAAQVWMMLRPHS